MRDADAPAGRAAVRLTLGLLQGALLSLLTAAAMRHVAPFDRPGVAVPLARLLFAVPGTLLLVWGRMRAGSVVALLGIVAAITLAVALHAADQGPVAAGFWFAGTFYRLLFELLLFIVLGLGLAAERDRRLWPGYPSLFEAAWNLAILLGLGGLFVLLGWGVLWLMAGLFAVIGFHGFVELLGRPWVWPLASCVAFSAAVAFCIEGERLVSGARRLALALFGLLLPILGVPAALFLVSLAFVPLSRLWTTHHAGLLLSLSAVLLIVLLNAVYQDGRTPAVLAMRLSGRLAGVVILPLGLLAGVALALRVHDHGWSAERVVAAGGFAILGLYGVGYLAAALAPGRWLRGIEPVNVGTAVFTVAVIAALLTPVADPARISVASQVARLRSGRVAPDRFDYAYLAHGSGLYGQHALSALVEHPPGDDATAVHDRAAAALSGVGRPAGPPGPTELAAMITVHPAGAALPDGLLAYAAGPAHPGAWLSCLHVRGSHCDAVLLPRSSDGRSHVAFLQDNLPFVVLFAETADGWRPGGTLVIPQKCSQARTALLAGQATLGSTPRPALVLPSAQFNVELPRDPDAPCGS